MCQKWHYDPRYKGLVSINTKNPIAAIKRAKAILANEAELMKKKQMNLESKPELLDTESEMDSKGTESTIDLTESLPNRLTRSAKRAIDDIINDSPSAPQQASNTTKKQKNQPKSKASEIKTPAPRRPRQQIRKQFNSKNSKCMKFIKFLKI